MSARWSLAAADAAFEAERADIVASARALAARPDRADKDFLRVSCPCALCRLVIAADRFLDGFKRLHAKVKPLRIEGGAKCAVNTGAKAEQTLLQRQNPLFKGQFIHCVLRGFCSFGASQAPARLSTADAPAQRGERS